MRTRPLIIACALALTALTACGGSIASTGAEGTTAIASDPGADSTTTPTTIAAETVVAAAAGNAATHDETGDYEWDASDVVTIALDGDSATAGSTAVTVDGSTVMITAAGTYSLSGSLTDGQVIVEAPDGALVRLILDGVDIASSTGAPIAVVNAGKAVVVLPAGTTNNLTDATTYAVTDGPDAALFSAADLTITGEGALSIDANYNDGIAGNDGVIVAGGAITIDAVDDGIRGKDYLVVKAGRIAVDAGGDGLKSDNEDDASLGYITIAGGTLDITSGGDGIDATTDVEITGGTVTVTSGGGSGATVGADSAKGIKGLVSVEIVAGDIEVDAADDAVHSNGDIVIAGGTFVLATGDDGIHADATLTIEAATIDITGSYEGLESAVITITSGDLEIHSSDDGINVAGGNDGSGAQQPGPGGRGGGPDAFVSGDYHLSIDGGTIVIYAQGDGLDSNGTIAMTGGTVIVHGPTANNNGAIDAGSFDISGGVLIAAGSAGMAEGVDASSSQAAMLVTFATEQAGTVVHIESTGGESLLTFEPAKDFASIVFSSPDLVDGASYDVYFGGTTTGAGTGGLYAAGAYRGGTLAGTVTLSG